MQAPTGFGKTVLAAALVANARAKGKRVLFTVPAISLVDQTYDFFYHQDVHDIGVIQASHPLTDWSKPVQIASVQTLIKKGLDRIPDADVVLVDECHRLFTFYSHWFRNLKWLNTPIIGLSATPWTKGLGKLYDELIVASTTQQLIDGGQLSPFKVFAPTKPELSDIATVAGDYHEGQLSARMLEPKLVGDAVEIWQALGENRPTLCYAVDRAHAKHLQAKFEGAGVPCAYQDAFTRDQERKAIKRDFHSGAVKVVVSVSTLTMGIDWNVGCISMNRPTKSDMLFVQIIGRGLRTAPGKDHCLILDHSDNHARLGFVTDVDVSHVGLHDGKMRNGENRTEHVLLPKRCPNCSFMKPPSMAKCSMCGFIAVVHNKVTPAAGELRELRKKPKNNGVIVDRGLFLAELKAYAQEKGYKPGWASNQYRERLHVWPNNEIKNVAPVLHISRETRGWIKSRLIAYHKGRANAG